LRKRSNIAPDLTNLDAFGIRIDHKHLQLKSSYRHAQSAPLEFRLLISNL